MTLSADRTDYPRDAKPRFTLTVVNTSADPCVVDIGDAAMELRVTSGDDRIWSTADCVGDRASKKEWLHRGVPHITEAAWDRERSWPDCRDQVVNARPGTYVVTLHSDYDEGAEAQVFRLN